MNMPSNRRKQAPKAALERIEREVRKGLNPKAISSIESVELIKKLKPALFDNMERYIRGNVRKQESGGKLEVMSELLTATINNFTFTSKELHQLLRTGLFQHKSYLHNSMEARYKKWVATGKGGRESFLNAYSFDYCLRRLGYNETTTQAFVGYNETITQVLGCVMYIDEYEGIILRYKERFDEIVDIVVDKYSGTVDIYLPNGRIERVIENRRLLGKWVVADKNNTQNTEGSNIHRKIEIKPTKKQLELNPDLKTFNMRSSHAIAISCYGFELAKHCIGSASLLSTFYIDRNSQNLRKDNLGIICRVENTKSNKIKDWHYNWVDYEKRVIRDRINEKDSLYYNSNEDMFKYM